MRTATAVGLVAVMLLGPLTAPAEAGHKFGVGFAAGAATVLFLHHLSQPHVYYAVPPPRVYYYPYSPPVYHTYPPVSYAPVPRCRSVWVEGTWREVPRDQGGGFTVYYPEWVPGHWERICP